jgi:hypothetical protein
MYDKKMLHDFALKMERINKQSENFVGEINIDEVAKQLGMSQRLGREVASYLHKLGWVIPHFGTSATLIITPKGFEELEKLNEPVWQRWLDRHPKTQAAIVTVITAMVVMLASEPVKHWLWPPPAAKP